MQIRLILYIMLLCFISCQQTPESDLKPLNLLEYGLPITIMAPDSAVVKTRDMIVQKDVTIKGGEKYSLQIYVSDANTTNIQEVLANQKELAKSNPYFSKMIKEEEDGFIFETVIDSTIVNYDFRFVKVRGDKEYVFQTGMLGSFSLEDVERMYSAVNPKVN